MKFIFLKLLIVLGFQSIFDGVSNHYIANAKESSSTSGAERSSDMGGRTGGCGRSN